MFTTTHPSASQFKTLHIALFLLAMAVSLAACEPIGGEYQSEFDDCRADEGTTVLEGAWKLSGSGERNACSSESLDSTYTFAFGRPIYITQDEDNNLNLRDEIEGFELKGKVRGRCVEFETREEWKGEVIRRFYTGTVNFGDVEGSFSGEGPSFCNTNGEFSVTID